LDIASPKLSPPKLLFLQKPVALAVTPLIMEQKAVYPGVPCPFQPTRWIQKISMNRKTEMRVEVEKVGF
jgi:hypothetical protein